MKLQSKHPDRIENELLCKTNETAGNQANGRCNQTMVIAIEPCCLAMQHKGFGIQHTGLRIQPAGNDSQLPPFVHRYRHPFAKTYRKVIAEIGIVIHLG